MTRLHEALERARLLEDQRGQESGPPPEAEAAPVPSTGATPDAWEFAAEQQTGGVTVTDGDVFRPEAQPPVATPEPAYDFITDRTADLLIVGPQVGSVFVEQYRRLSAALHHAQTQTGARNVMVASAVESEGKTLTAANIALTLSHSYERKVLLIDADLRRPSQHKLFNLPNEVGLSDVLKPGHAETRLPVQRVSTHLWVMTAGQPNPDPMSGLVSETMRQVLADASEQFDWIVIDTSPVALLPDANLLAAMIDLALIIVRAESTPYPLVQRAIDAIGQERVLGVVLNRAEEKEAQPGYYGYKYKYAYSYGHLPRSNSARRWSWLPFGRSRAGNG